MDRVQHSLCSVVMGVLKDGDIEALVALLEADPTVLSIFPFNSVGD